jgi:hypothetical protein
MRLCSCSPSFIICNKLLPNTLSFLTVAIIVARPDEEHMLCIKSIPGTLMQPEIQDDMKLYVHFI